MPNARIAVAAALFAVFAAAAVEAWGMAGLAGRYPQVLTTAALLLTALVAAGEVGSARRLAGTDGKPARPRQGTGGQRVMLLGFVACWLLYTAALQPLGFLVATGLAIAVSLRCLGLRRPVAVVLTAALFAAGMAVLLKTVLYVPVPAGPLDLALERLLFALRR